MITPIADSTYTSCVVISSEAESFVNEIHDHKEEQRSSNELHTELQGSVESGPCEERKRRPSNKETCANSFSNPPQRASLYTQRTIPTNERKWKVIHAASPDQGHLETKTVTNMLRHYDQEERQTDDSRLGLQLGQH